MSEESKEKDYIIKDKRSSEEIKKVRDENIIPPHNPPVATLRELNPLLGRFSDIEIGDFVAFLAQKGFIWHDAEKTFYHDKLQFSIRTQGLDLFVNTRDGLEEIITTWQNMHNKYPDEYSKITAEIGMWNKTQRSAMLFGALGLFFGWIIFKWKMWLFYECFCLISVLVSVRIQGMLLRKLDGLKGKESLR